MKNIEIVALKKAIFSLEEELENLPHVKLRCKTSNGCIQWYEKGPGDEKTRYIPKANREYAKKLAYYTYGSEYLDELKKKLAIMQRQENVSDNIEALKRKYFCEKTGFASLLRDYHNLEDQKSIAWINENYETNPYKTEELVYNTLDGRKVRSKSEVMIADYLFEHKIPYRYECALDLGGWIVYPDFIIRRVSDGKILVWEHFGMMDNYEYAEKTNKKIASYIEKGIIPSENFITSFESKNKPFSSVDVVRLATMYELGV